MHYYEVAPNQIIRPGSTSFTYCSDKNLKVGTIVSIEVGKKNVVGIVTQSVERPAYQTKPITQVIESQPLPQPLINLCLWLSVYYATHLATVLQGVLPRGLQKKRRARDTPHVVSARNRTKNVFTQDQLAALSTIHDMTSGAAILHGITGSGKTAVYIEAAKKALAQGRSAVILVPEIALTTQLVSEFSHHFKNILLTHSRQTEAERHLTWREALYTTEPRVAIGPRSALFLPLSNIGFIAVDEFHEPSFKQEQSPRYSALRATSMLGASHQAKIIFGSATPPVADYYIAKQTHRPIIEMSHLAQLEAIKPSVTLIDMTKKQNFKTHRFISDTLLSHIQKTIDKDNQVLLFHNRRGSASMTLCENCGWSALCPRCFIPYTLHADKHLLQCHVCGLTEKVPTSCPKCGSVEIYHKGIGTKLIESEIRKLFPKQIIARFDGDSETGESVDSRYKDLYDGKINIIIGTQVIAKGLDLPHLRTVGVIQADSGLGLPDYGASERTFQLLAQVVGRVGRSRHTTNVIIQSYQPTHPAVTDGIAQNYQDFYNAILSERRRSNFPPFTFLLKVTCVYKTEAAAIKNARSLANDIRKAAPAHVQILGPTPAFYERQHDTYRWQLIIKSPKRSSLVAIAKTLTSPHIQFELDPISLL